MENNPYIICGELEESLNRNQRDLLDYYMIELNGAETIEDLISIIQYIKNNYDGQSRMNLEWITNFWSEYSI